MRIKLVVCVINKKQFNILFYRLYAKFLWRVLRYVLNIARNINDLSNEPLYGQTFCIAKLIIDQR
jgi:hypothetical protein